MNKYPIILYLWSKMLILESESVFSIVKDCALIGPTWPNPALWLVNLKLSWKWPSLSLMFLMKRIWNWILPTGTNFYHQNVYLNKVFFPNEFLTGIFIILTLGKSVIEIFSELKKAAERKISNFSDFVSILFTEC